MSNTSLQPLLYLVEPLSGENVVHEQLKQLGDYTVLRDSEQRLLNRLPVDVQVSVIIFDFDTVDSAGLASIFRVTRHFNGIPVLVLAREIPVDSYQKVAGLKTTVTLQKKSNVPDLKTTLDKMVSGEEITPTRYPRFQTDQEVRLVVLSTGLLIPTRMRNYSATGAFLEYRGISLKVGDQLQIGVANDQYVRPRSSTQFRAKVVWLSAKSNNDVKTRGVGIQFVAPVTMLGV